MLFDILCQSGDNQPNSIEGLVMWLDASEAGTLSRKGTLATKIYDKAPGGFVLMATSAQTKPRILQSRFNGKTVLRFDNPPQYLTGLCPNISENDDLFMVAVINGQLMSDCITMIGRDKNLVTIPFNEYEGPFELAELLVYDVNTMTEEQLEWVCDYLIDKWQL